MGLGFNGFEEKGKVKWDVCVNMKVWFFEINFCFIGIIVLFNININVWVVCYIFK